MALNSMIELFADNRQERDKEKALFIEEPYKEIGQLKVELDWLEKIWGKIENRDSDHFFSLFLPRNGCSQARINKDI